MYKKLTYFIQSFILVLMFVSIFSACGGDDAVTNYPVQEPVDTSSFEYPFITGSYWNYSQTLTVENIRPDSIRYLFSSYPLTGNGYSEVLYDTNIAIGGTVRIIYDRLIQGNDTAASRYYYTNSINSLVCYGFRGGSTPSFPFRKQQQAYIIADGIVYDSFSKMSSVIAGNYGYRSLNDTFIVLSPVVVSLKYPVLRNTEWVIFNFGSNIISKKYISWENYHLDTATIPCIKTQRIWSNNSNYIFYDYYSKYGQMKRDYTFKNQPVTNMSGITIGYVDYKEVYNVISFNIAAR